MRKFLFALPLLFITLGSSFTLKAQDLTPAPATQASSATYAINTLATASLPDAPSDNLYAAGLSYSVNATPALAGTALQAHLLSASTKTYQFAAIDVLPNTIKPFTVTSNVGVGVAQQVLAFTVKGNSIPLYMPVAAGTTWSGSNVGWEWNGGVIAAIPYKGFLLLPSVRFLKSSVSNGTGYQPILGILIGKRSSQLLPSLSN